MAVNLADYVTENEGYRRDMYKDSLGIWSIGIGINLEQGLSLEESKLILNHRLDNNEVVLKKKIPSYIHLCAVRKILLQDMAYNLGITGLLNFRKMLAALDRGAYQLAAKEMLDSRYAKQVRGRALRNAHMMETGEWYAH